MILNPTTVNHWIACGAIDLGKTVTLEIGKLKNLYWATILCLSSCVYPKIITLKELETSKSSRTLNASAPSSFHSVMAKLKKPHQKKMLSYQELFWWQIFPTTGLQLEQPFWPLTYPFLPHAFPLWQMAPACGKGVRIAVIDTGVSAFTFCDGQNSFFRHPNLTVAGDFTKERHVVLPQKGQRQTTLTSLADMIEHFTSAPFTRSELDAVLLTWIQEYTLCKTTAQFDTYIQQYGSETLFNAQKKFPKKRTLSFEGQRFKRNVLSKESGFGAFTCTDLQEFYNQKHVCTAYIPTPFLDAFTNIFSKNYGLDHGTHVLSIIGAQLHVPQSFHSLTTDNIQKLFRSTQGFSGLAPQSKLRMIKGLYPQDATDPTFLIQALELAHTYTAQVVNLSFKLDERYDPQSKLMKEFEKALKVFPYVCVSAGNRDAVRHSESLSYPAQCTGSTISVGAFECSFDDLSKTYRCPVSAFSEYEEGVGPLYLAPGKNILGCSFVPNRKETLFALHTGTSYAAPIMTGFLGLMLSEFDKKFSKEELLFVCQSSCLRLHATSEWKQKTVYGVLDMRTALFTLHVLAQLQTVTGYKKEFKRFVSIIHSVIFEMADGYGKKNGITVSFKESYMDYFNALHKKQSFCYFNEGPFKSFPEALEYVREVALKKISKENFSYHH